MNVRPLPDPGAPAGTVKRGASVRVAMLSGAGPSRAVAAGEAEEAGETLPQVHRNLAALLAGGLAADVLLWLAARALDRDAPAEGAALAALAGAAALAAAGLVAGLLRLPGPHRRASLWGALVALPLAVGPLALALTLGRRAEGPFAGLVRDAPALVALAALAIYAASAVLALASAAALRRWRSEAAGQKAWLAWGVGVAGGALLAALVALAALPEQAARAREDQSIPGPGFALLASFLLAAWAARGRTR